MRINSNKIKSKLAFFLFSCSADHEWPTNQHLNMLSSLPLFVPKRFSSFNWDKHIPTTRALDGIFSFPHCLRIQRQTHKSITYVKWCRQIRDASVSFPTKEHVSRVLYKEYVSRCSLQWCRCLLHYEWDNSVQSLATNPSPLGLTTQTQRRLTNDERRPTLKKEWWPLFVWRLKKKKLAVQHQTGIDQIACSLTNSERTLLERKKYGIFLSSSVDDPVLESWQMSS